MAVKTLETQEMLVNMGPQHPSTHGVLRLVVDTDGEVVINAVPDIGFLHRCAEKIGENLTCIQYVPYTDRMDYLSSMSDNLAYCLAVEKMAQIEVPPRARHIRVIMAELNRIASHLLAFATYGLDVGAFTPFLYAFREREEILNMFEYISGARLTYNYVRVGGVAQDVDAKFAEMVDTFFKKFGDRVKDYNELLTYNRIFIERTRGIGVFAPEQAIAYGVSGSNLRASGVNYDIRKTNPYSGYENFQFDVPLGRDREGVLGDCWNRYYVRIEEMFQSMKIVKQAMESLPQGSYATPMKRAIKLPKGETYVKIENPRGELGFYLIGDGTDKPTRVRIRAPSFCTLSFLPETVRGVLIADLVAILGSIDIVLGEVDR